MRRMQRFVACCSLRDSISPWDLGSLLFPSEFGVLDKQRKRRLRFGNSGGTHSAFLLSSTRCRALLDDTTNRSSGIWSSFSEFFQRIVVSEDTTDTTCSDHSAARFEVPSSSLSELPLLQVCPRTLPVPLDTDAVEDVLSQLLYAGFGNLSSTLDDLLAVIFPKSSTEDEFRVMNTTTATSSELSASSSRCVTAQELGSLEAFHSWLKCRLPDGDKQLELWGTATGTKRVANLWRELLEGEISMEDSQPPKRTVNVASVLIRNEGGQMLVEAYQEMADGRIRPRNRPLSEKMRPGETVEEACLRGIVEELGEDKGSSDKVKLLRESYLRQEEERESFSYPGLFTRYVIHTMTAHVQQLPSSDFDTEEDEECHAGATAVAPSTSSSSTNCASIGVRKHFWKWV